MLKIQNLEDEELIFFIRLQCDEALTILLERYTLSSRRLVTKIIQNFPLSGVNFESLVNVALNGVIIALRKYEEQGKRFFSFWYSIARREVMDYLKTNSYTGKSSGFAGISMDSHTTLHDDDTAIVSEAIGEIDEDLSATLLFKEFVKIIKSDDAVMKPLDKEIFFLYLRGYQKEQIFDMLGCSKSTYYRALEKGKFVLAQYYQKVE